MKYRTYIIIKTELRYAIFIKILHNLYLSIFLICHKIKYIYPEIPPVFITTPWNPWFCWIFAKIALLYFITTKSLAHPKNIEFIGFLVVVIIFSEILGYIISLLCTNNIIYRKPLHLNKESHNYRPETCFQGSGHCCFLHNIAHPQHFCFLDIKSRNTNTFF